MHYIYLISGHLLPRDIPAAALNMFNRFLVGTTFHDISLPSDDIYINRGRGHNMMGSSLPYSNASNNYLVFLFGIISVICASVAFTFYKYKRLVATLYGIFDKHLRHTSEYHITCSIYIQVYMLSFL